MPIALILTVGGFMCDGSECVKFRVATLAQTRPQQSAVLAALNLWYEALA